jgi:hypothetical protein
MDPNLFVWCLCWWPYELVAWWQRNISPSTYVILSAAAVTAQFYMLTETFADFAATPTVSLAVGFALAGPAYRPMVIRLARPPNDHHRR